MENVNEKHKDTVFTFLFSNPALLRELYSAIEGITLPPDARIDINTLSDAFMKNDTKINLPLELVVQVYNINKGRNQEILSKSRTLGSYSLFIAKIREYQKEYQGKYNEKKKVLDKTFKSAINYCIKNNILKDFLKRHGSEAHKYARRSRVDE